MNCWNLFLPFAILLVVQDSSCQREIVETILLPQPFEEITTKGKFDVYLIQTSSTKPSKIEVGARRDTFYNVTYRISDALPRVLTIEGQPIDSASIYVRIHFNKTLQRYIHGAEGDISTNRFGIANPGPQKFILTHLKPGLVTLKLDIAEFIAILHGSGDYEFSGVVRQRAVLNVKDFAFVNAFSLKPKEAVITVSGNSTVQVTATDRLKIEAGDTAQVLYRFSRTLQRNETITNPKALIQRVI